MSMPAPGLPEIDLPALAGHFSVRRLVYDHLTGDLHRFEGVAVIDPSGFMEKGEVRNRAGRFTAERRYGLQPGAMGIDVVFPDGRPFISLCPQSGEAVHHLCGSDDYQGRFIFSGSGKGWIERWRVTGPRKHYLSLSRYRLQEP
jgi:hypothetical protein